MPAAVPLSTFQELERRLPRLRRVNQMLLLGLALLITGLSWDAARWIAQVRRPVEPVQPGLGGLRAALPVIPALDLPERLFVGQESAPVKGATPPPTVAEGAGWKLKGVLTAGTRRAMLEEPEKKNTVWVTEGQQIGSWKVLRIEERSVLLEKDGATHEIRM